MMRITGQMSEQGADKARMELFKGFKFLLVALGIGGGLALLFWQKPDFLEVLANFIITLKNS